MTEDAKKRRYNLWTYIEDWNDYKKENNLTDKELHDMVERALQLVAWADILDQLEEVKS